MTPEEVLDELDEVRESETTAKRTSPTNTPCATEDERKIQLDAHAVVSPRLSRPG